MSTEGCGWRLPGYHLNRDLANSTTKMSSDDRWQFSRTMFQDLSVRSDREETKVWPWAAVDHMAAVESPER
jgi:hypothetical protein